MADNKTETAGAEKSASTVIIACKHQPGIFMQVWGSEDIQEQVLGGGSRTVKRAVPLGDAIKINGPATPFGETAKSLIVNGYAMTPNVPADFARKWMKDNAKSHLVKNRIIYIANDESSAKAVSKENRDVVSGLEPLNPGTKLVNGRTVPVDYRWPRKLNANLSEIGTDTKNSDAA